MKPEQAIQERIEVYRKMQEKAAEGGNLRAADRYVIRGLELEWVLDDDA